MPTRSHGRNVARYSANVRPFAWPADAKLTRFGSGIGILLQKWCTFAIQRTGSQLRSQPDRRDSHLQTSEAKIHRPAKRNSRQGAWARSEEHTSELQSLRHLVCRL